MSPLICSVLVNLSHKDREADNRRLLAMSLTNFFNDFISHFMRFRSLSSQYNHEYFVTSTLFEKFLKKLLEKL